MKLMKFSNLYLFEEMFYYSISYWLKLIYFLSSTSPLLLDMKITFKSNLKKNDHYCPILVNYEYF